MAPEEAIVLALATGAAARMEPNVFARERPEVAAYHELAALLARTYPAVDARMMEIGPGSQERQQHLAEQIRQHKAAEDAAVLRKSRCVLQAIVRNVPQASTAVFADDSTVSKALVTSERHLEEQ
jgi:hypothetical protein